MLCARLFGKTQLKNAVLLKKICRKYAGKFGKEITEWETCLGEYLHLYSEWSSR